MFSTAGRRLTTTELIASMRGPASARPAIGVFEGEYEQLVIANKPIPPPCSGPPPVKSLRADVTNSETALIRL
jgi:hypothetical protein